MASALFFAFLCALMPGLPGFAGDMEIWKIWATHNATQGLPNAYDSGTNYTPLYHYILWLFGIVMNTPEAIGRYITFIRVFTLLAEFGGLYLVYRWCERTTDYLIILFISILNIGYSYNTLIWGQVDAIPAALSFATLYYLHRGKAIVSGAMLILAVNMKLQAIIFLPLWGLLYMEYLARTRRWNDAVLTIVVMAGLQGLILLPFAFSPHGLTQVWHNAVTLVGAYTEVSVNAHNVWYFVFPDTHDRLSMDDTMPFIGELSYRTAGLILFCTTAFAAFLPLLRIALRQISSKRAIGSGEPPAGALVLITAALTTLLFFYFNTEMHERYSHFAAIFLTAYAFSTRRWLAYILFSIAYFLNLEEVMRWLGLPNYGTLIFNQQFISGVFAFTIIVLFRELYWHFGTSNANVLGLVKA